MKKGTESLQKQEQEIKSLVHQGQIEILWNRLS